MAALAVGAREPMSLLAFGLGGFAAGTALRQLGSAVARHRWGGVLGRTNGGMVVHLGVVLVAIALVASGTYARAGEFRLKPGQSARLAGHTVTYLGTVHETTARAEVTKSRVRVDGGQVYAPALSLFPFASRAIGTPSVRSRVVDDVYLRLETPPTDPAGPAVIGVIVQPLILWLWLGGAVIGLGTILAAGGRRRRRKDGLAEELDCLVAENADQSDAPDAMVGSRAR